MLLSADTIRKMLSNAEALVSLMNSGKTGDSVSLTIEEYHDLAETCLNLFARVAELEKDYAAAVALSNERWNYIQGKHMGKEPFFDRGTGCLWDSMPETFPGSGIKIAGLVCPCPKCSVRC